MLVGQLTRANFLPGVFMPITQQNFFQQQAVHRRAAFKWFALAAILVLALTLTISLLLAPLCFALIGLITDVFSRIMVTPNIIGDGVALLDKLTDAPAQHIGQIALFCLFAALPGFAILVLLCWRLGQWSADGNWPLITEQLQLREPNQADLEEQQIQNVVDEMALAAGCAAPKLLISEMTNCNLAMLGAPTRGAIIVTRGLLQQLDREQTQALVAQALAGLINGDGRLGERMMRLIEILGLLMLLSRAPFDGETRTLLRPLFALASKTSSSSHAALLQRTLASPFQTNSATTSTKEEQKTWRDYAWLPLMGSSMIGLIVVPITTLFFLAPFLGMMWRKRRYQADAAAVQFTRNPSALAAALTALSNNDCTIKTDATWLVNLFVVSPMSHANAAIASPYPAVQKRIDKLIAMGADAKASESNWLKAILIWMIAVPLVLILGGLSAVLIYLGVMVSVMLNMVFLAPVIGILHWLLRRH
jgi:Zn-dependent protease with chaperone function